MKQLTRLALMLATASLLSSQVYASEARIPDLRLDRPVAVFSETDINAMFEPSNRSMQLAVLSQQQMKETEGAWWPLLYYAPMATSALYAAYQTSAYMPLYHFFHPIRHWNGWR
ncbi:MAG: hypothetical protein ACN6O8_07705 [Achromobacter sp.]|uniref:hypothetical protein n=1 Tax=Achromobacter sp. TaxID=134375 RepID=UPI003CFF2ADD